MADPLTAEQIAELRELYEQSILTLTLGSGDAGKALAAGLRFAAEIHKHFPALLETLAEKDAEAEQLRSTCSSLEDYIRGIKVDLGGSGNVSVKELAESLRAELQQKDAAIVEALNCDGGMCTHCIDVLLTVDPRQKEQP